MEAVHHGHVHAKRRQQIGAVFHLIERHAPTGAAERLGHHAFAVEHGGNGDRALDLCRLDRARSCVAIAVDVGAGQGHMAHGAEVVALARGVMGYMLLGMAGPQKLVALAPRGDLLEPRILVQRGDGVVEVAAHLHRLGPSSEHQHWQLLEQRVALVLLEAVGQRVGPGHGSRRNGGLVEEHPRNSLAELVAMAFGVGLVGRFDEQLHRRRTQVIDLVAEARDRETQDAPLPIRAIPTGGLGEIGERLRVQRPALVDAGGQTYQRLAVRISPFQRDLDRALGVMDVAHQRLGVMLGACAQDARGRLPVARVGRAGAAAGPRVLVVDPGLESLVDALPHAVVDHFPPAFIQVGCAQPLAGVHEAAVQALVHELADLSVEF